MKFNPESFLTYFISFDTARRFLLVNSHFSLFSVTHFIKFTKKLGGQVETISPLRALYQITPRALTVLHKSTLNHHIRPDTVLYMTLIFLLCALLEEMFCLSRVIVSAYCLNSSYRISYDGGA